MDNMPPKRIKASDTKDLFPQIGIENSEQIRLAKIADSISGLAQQLAEHQRQNRAGSQEQPGNMTQKTPWSQELEE